jgi:hypothetical protein
MTLCGYAYLCWPVELIVLAKSGHGLCCFVHIEAGN